MIKKKKILKVLLKNTLRKNQFVVSFIRTIKNSFHPKIMVFYLTDINSNNIRIQFTLGISKAIRKNMIHAVKNVNKITRVLYLKSATTAAICNLLKQLLLTLITAP